MGKFSFINLLSEGNTSDDFHKERKLEAEHTSFKRRRIAESEIVKPVSRFTFADFLKSQNVELTEPAALGQCAEGACTPWDEIPAPV